MILYIAHIIVVFQVVEFYRFLNNVRKSPFFLCLGKTVRIEPATTLFIISHTSCLRRHCEELGTSCWHVHETAESCNEFIHAEERAQKGVRGMDIEVFGRNGIYSGVYFFDKF